MTFGFRLGSVPVERFARLLPIILGVLIIAANGELAWLFLRNFRHADAQAEHALQAILLRRSVALGW